MQSLATKYRPKDWQSIEGQDSIIKILSKQLALRQFKNSYLFCGASGCGKTTTARIFAEEINNHIGSPIEIDGASNNGVDNVKEIIKAASERSIDSEYKIYIIDECHMLTTAAWNALLKCIEEPPTYTIFIFCTTDPQKVPATIINRCMRFEFSRLTTSQIYSRLIYICEQEGFSNYEETVEYVSKISKGQMRDAIANIEKIAAYDTDLCIQNAFKALGDYSYDVFFELINGLIDGSETHVMEFFDKIYNSGIDLKLFVDQFLTFCLNVNKAILLDISVTQIPNSYIEKVQSSTNFANASSYYNYVIDKLLLLKNMLKTDSSPRSTVEVVLLQICRCV